MPHLPGISHNMYDRDVQSKEDQCFRFVNLEKVSHVNSV